MHTGWDTDAELATGTARHVVVRNGRLRLDDRDSGRWTSPWVEPGFDLTEVIPSWEARTPGDSSVTVELRARTADGTGGWDSVARWALDDHQLKRTSLDSQPDDLGRMAYDTWLANTPGVTGWRLRVTLLRRAGSHAKVTVGALGAMASRLPSTADATTSKPGPEALGTVLPVPRMSQMIHEGEYPQYDGGGEAWCSPTSTTMVLGYYDALPGPTSYAWVDTSYDDRVVDHSARMTYDRGFGGTGNWSFNTAYAASRVAGADGGGAFVTRLRSLREAQRFIAAGIPLIASVTFSSGQLDGAPISATSGHLLVIVGFDKSGDVVVNDPAAASRSGVRRTYDRGQFEDAWLKRYASGSSMRGSGGMVYVVHDAAHPLPERNRNRNW